MGESLTIEEQPATEPARVALVGCGNISSQYLASLPKLANLRLVSVTDTIPEAAARIAAEQGVPARSLEEVLADPEVDVILNLTPPQVHASLTIQALEAGKHVYLEKPFSVTAAETEAMLAAAQAADRRIGSAPDTVLGTGIQTSRKLIDDGEIGIPVAATAFMMAPGHELWHPNPAYYYRIGAGPLLDMGVYYLTALVTMLGPIESVAGMGSRTRTERVVPEGAPRAGDVMPVEVDTYVTSLIRHTSGVLSTLIVSFDTMASVLPRIEVYGTTGTVAVPDPNHFSNVPQIARGAKAPFEDAGTLAGYADAGRGYGLSDMVRAISEKAPHRQSTELGAHVNEVMERILESIESNAFVKVGSTCERPPAVPLGSTPDKA